MAHLECAGPLIATKDRLHRQWYKLQSYPQKMDGQGFTLLDTKLLDSIVEESQEAVNVAKECAAKPEYIAIASALLTRLEDKIKSSNKTRYVGRIYYELPPSMASAILTDDINKLINNIHEMGRSFVETKGTYGGCKLEKTDDTRELNRAVLSYCEGVHGSALLRKSGTVVEHKMGAHSNVITLKEEEDGYNANIIYTESGAQNWDSRQQGVMDYLSNNWGIECEAKGLSAECQGKVKSSSQLIEMAYFFSSIRDVDLLSQECVWEAIKWAESEAARTIEDLKDKSYTRVPYPNDTSEWRSEVCPYDEERERRRRREDRLAELEHSANYWSSKGRLELDKAAKSPCTLGAYSTINQAISAVEDLAEVCREIKDIGGGAFDCDSDESSLRDYLDKGIKELIERCPLEPIIKTLEAQHTGYELKYHLYDIEWACDYIEDDDCRRLIDEAIARDKAGVKPLALPLEV